MQRWRQIPIGRSFDLQPLYSGNWEIDLSFDSASITMMREWSEAASSGSLNMTVLDQYKTTFTDLSAVSLEMVEAPAIEAGVSMPWNMIVRGASPNS